MPLNEASRFSGLETSVSGFFKTLLKTSSEIQGRSVEPFEDFPSKMPFPETFANTPGHKTKPLADQGIEPLDTLSDWNFADTILKYSIIKI